MMTYNIVRICGIQRKTSRHLSASTLNLSDDNGLNFEPHLLHAATRTLHMLESADSSLEVVSCSNRIAQGSHRIALKGAMMLFMPSVLLD